MTQQRVLKLAWREALRVWTVEKEFLEKYPDDELAKIREERAYKELIDIERMARKLDEEA